MDYMVKNFFIVSLEFLTSGSDAVCYSAVALSETISEYIKSVKDCKDSVSLVIKKCVASDEITRDLTKDEFIEMYFDNIEWVVKEVLVVEQITIPINY